jgi:hypothetical protein
MGKGVTSNEQYFRFIQDKVYNDLTATGKIWRDRDEKCSLL